MPRYTPSPDEEELYGSVKPPGSGATEPASASPADTTQEPTPESETEEPESTDEEMSSDETSAIVPNKVLMGKSGSMPKEGDTVTLRVVKVYGDEAEVCCVSPKETGSYKEPMMSSDSEIEAMDTERM